MTEFFSGWRRKTGFAILVAVCALMVGWVRSHNMCDCFRFRIGTWIFCIMSMHNGLGWCRIIDPTPAGRIFDFLTGPLDGIWPTDPFTEPFSGYRVEKWKCLGFLALEAELIKTPGDVLTLWFVSYWMLVAPPTLLSAYLLLKKPRVVVSKSVREN